MENNTRKVFFFKGFSCTSMTVVINIYCYIIDVTFSLLYITIFYPKSLPVLITGVSMLAKFIAITMKMLLSYV